MATLIVEPFISGEKQYKQKGKTKFFYFSFKKMGKKWIIILSALFSIIIVPSFASAVFWECFAKGQVIDFCNPRVPDRTCDSDMGCQFCMGSYNASRNCYNQGNWMACNSLTQGCTGTGNGSIDSEPPVLTVNSPTDYTYYSGRAVPFSVSANEEVDIYYYDNINGRGVWTRVCTDCFSWDGARNFNEGFNNITIKATDVMGHSSYQTVVFSVDSKKPKIKKTYPPKNEFVSSEFTVEYDEENVKEVMFYYGASQQQLNGCPSGKKQQCSIDVDLSAYDGQLIEYWFTIKDIADALTESKHVFVNVDETYPVINNPGSIYAISGRYAYFNISVTELNFDELSYYDHSDTSPRWRKLCSRLREDLCKVKKSFREGHHLLDIQITDKAGNSIGQSIEFDINY